MMCSLCSRTEDREASFDIHGHGGEIADANPVGDEAIARALVPDLETDLRPAGTRRGRNHGPQHVPVGRPIEREPACRRVGGDLTAELHAGPGAYALGRSANELPQVGSV